LEFSNGRLGDRSQKLRSDAENDELSMSAQSPIPLRPDRDAMRAVERRSLVRACTAIILGAKPGARHPEDIVKVWGDDATAARVLKAAMSPTSTASYPQMQATAVLPMLAPASASARLLAAASSLDLGGVASIRLPFIGASGRPAVPFVAEDSPGPVADLSVSATTLGPAKKLLILAALTRETQEASAGTAEAIISNALAVAAEQSLDTALLGNAAASAIQPAGILNGVVPIAATAGGGVGAIAGDLAALAGAIGAAGINPDDMVIITTPTLAMKIRVLASPKFSNLVLSSSALAAGTVIGIVPAGLVTGYSGNVSIERSNAAAMHFEDTTPADIVTGAGAVAVPVKSAFQVDMLLLKVRGWCAWVVHPGAVASISGATW
jgi:hypothetical protein